MRAGRRIRRGCGVVLLGLLSLMCAASWAWAQEATPQAPQGSLLPSGLTLNGFLDTYYVYDFTRPDTQQRPGFLYNHSRHNELSINLATIGLAYESAHVHGALGLMAGTYSEYNYAAEQDNLQSLLEAWAGVRLHPTLWIDAGLFGSHIGFESAKSVDNPTLTRSIQAENSPYYLAGVRLMWSPTNRLTLGAVVANGWQNIQETQDNSSKGGGTQINWRPNDWLTLNSSTWISNELPDYDSRLRLFHDLYLLADLGELVSLSAGLDVGAQQRGDGEEGWSYWYGGVLIVHQQWSSWLATAQRLEYYADPDQVIVSAGPGAGLNVFGASLNVDIKPYERVMWRVEGRLLRDQVARFGAPTRRTKTNIAATTSLALSF